jgi:DNA-binding SARP family transcriptional activator/formylglycine-generating enzyme required for sulfatase activity/dienelactone hydrolase
MIRFRTLGAIDLRDGNDTELRAILAQPKRLALLAYLALARRDAPRRRDTIVGLFWPELDESRARGALNSAIHFLRQWLGSETIESRSAQELAVDERYLWCDAASFDDAVAAHDHATALDLYKGEYLHGLILEHARPFDEWLEHERTRIRSAAARTARSLAERCESEHNVNAAVNYARQAVALAGMDERAVRGLLELLDRLGDRAGALDAYQSFADQLATEFEVEPDAETQALVARLRSRSRKGSAAAGVGSDDAPLATASVELAPPREWETITSDTAVRSSAAPAVGGRRITPVGVAAGIVSLFVFQGSGASHERDEQWVREIALPAIRQHVKDVDYQAAHDLAREAAEILPFDSTLRATWSAFTTTVAVSTQPAGALVHRAPVDDTTNWEQLGTTPMTGVRIPREVVNVTPSIFRVTRPGFRTRYVPLSGLRSQLVLDSVRAGDDDEVRVTGGSSLPAMFALGDVKGVELMDFFMDRFEVTNREYQAFVDAGGYENPAYWEHEFLLNGRPVPLDQAVARFVDRTGYLGPAAWEGGRFPLGEDDLPVGGVSWYEASAYAKWKGKSLPTVFHWHRAAAMGMGAYMIPQSNMESAKAVPAKTPLGMSAFGLFNMAGNVREWCVNATGTRRFILGGGWHDLPYMLMDAFSHDPFDRSIANGIRLVRYAPDDTTLPLAMRPLERSERDFLREAPVSDAEFGRILQFYEYDRTALNTKLESRDSTEDWIRERVTIDAAYGGERLPVWVYRPRHVAPPYQPVVFFPGSGALVIRNGLANITAADFLVRSGRAVIYPIYKSTHERKDGMPTVFEKQTVAYREHMQMWVKDFSRTIDYLASRDDIDTSRVAYYGVSWGGAMGAIIPAIEPRLKTAILYVAGLTVERARPEVEPLNFLPRVTLPVLMLSGKFDPYHPVESSQKPFMSLLGTPVQHKRHVIDEGGHFVSRALLVAESLKWLDKYLGPVRQITARTR